MNSEQWYYIKLMFKEAALAYWEIIVWVGNYFYNMGRTWDK